MQAYQVETIQDIVKYWRQCLNDAKPSSTKQAVAGWMVGIHNSDMDFDEYYDDPYFDELMSAAEALELVGDYDPTTIAEYWQKIIESLPQLEEKYLH